MDETSARILTLMFEKRSGEIIRKYGNGNDWQLEKYRIKYWTKDNYGKPVQLNADVAFINAVDPSVQRELKCVSVFSTYFNTNNETTLYAEDILFPCRAAFDELVVYPFSQGVFCDFGNHRIPNCEHLLKARQAIDCELAALSLIDRLGIRIKKEYHTGFLGLSNGGGTSLAAMYLLENDPYYSRVNEEKIHLKGTYCGSGVYSYALLAPSIATPETGTGHIFKKPLQPILYTASLIGAMDNWAEYFKHSDGSPIDETEYYSESFLEKRFTLDDSQVDFLTLYKMGGIDYFADLLKFQNLSISDVVNPDLLKVNDGVQELDTDKEIVRCVVDAIRNNDVMLDGWTPKSDLVMKHSTTDDLVPVELALDVYRTLGDAGKRENVSFSTINAFDHVFSAAYFGMSDVAMKAEPYCVESYQ